MKLSQRLAGVAVDVATTFSAAIRFLLVAVAVTFTVVTATAGLWFWFGGKHDVANGASSSSKSGTQTNHRMFARETGERINKDDNQCDVLSPRGLILG